MPAPTVATEFYDAVFLYMEQLGYSEEELCDRMQIRSRTEFRNNGRIPLGLYQQAFVVAEEITGDTSFGLHMGAAGRPDHEGIFYLLSLTAKDVPQILNAFSRYLPIAFDFIQLDLQPLKDCLRIGYRFGVPKVNHHLVEYMMAYWYCAANRIGFDEINVPRVIYFEHAAAEREQEIRHVFRQTPVMFGQPRNGFDLKLECLQHHTNEFDSTRFALSETRATQMLIRMRGKDRIASETLNCICDLMPQGVPNIEEVARRMNCSGRTLQRRLSERNLNFQMLLDFVRKDQAMHLLLQTSMPITQIATRIGFSDDSTFHRAFRRWTGVSPGYYRN